MTIRNSAQAIGSASARSSARVAPVASDVEPAARSSWLQHITVPRISLLVAALVLTWGFRFPTDRYITPERGIGYALGIIGGSLMLLLLLYPARKRARWLGFIGTVKRWFQAHMFLGVVGPMCVLFHSNFSLGATNSNVALWSMIVVAASGLVGRYFYTKLHHGLHGRRATLNELAERAANLKRQGFELGVLPEVLARIDGEEGIITGSKAPWFVKPFWAHWQVLRARRRLRHRVRAAMAANTRQSASQEARLRQFALRHIDERLSAARRVAEIEGFERLFSWWHVLHLPLFFMLLVAGIVHVIAVHVY